jgi:aspartate racemase
MKEKIVGILGGKGPEATDVLLQLIIKHTPVSVEEDHLRVIIDNNPKIPKPALAITGEGPDSVPALTETARNLEKAGADFLVIPCNSAHYFLDQIRSAITIPVLSIIDATVEAARNHGCKKVAVLATSGLISSEIYQKGLSEAGMGVLIPQPEEQERLMKQIIHFKDSGEMHGLKEVVSDLVKALQGRGADAVALACTEIPVVYSGEESPVICFDTIDILARAAVRYAKGTD